MMLCCVLRVRSSWAFGAGAVQMSQCPSLHVTLPRLLPGAEIRTEMAAGGHGAAVPHVVEQVRWTDTCGRIL